MIAPRTTWNLEVRQAPGGRQAWLEDLHVAHGPGLRLMLRRMLGNDDDALDAYQDCMYHLARRSERTPLLSVRAYAYRTAANLATEIIRRRGRHAAHWRRIMADQRARVRLSDQPSPDSIDHDNGQVVGRLRGALGSLPRHLRDVVVLRDLAQMPYRRVASILGIRPTTARVYRRQAVLRLGDVLSRDGVTAAR